MSALENKGSFLRSDEKSWVSSSLFFMSLMKLTPKYETFYIPTGVTLTNEQLLYYSDALLDLLCEIEFADGVKEHKDYVRQISFILRSWSKEGYSVKVV